MTYENDEHKRVVGSIHSHPGISTLPSCTDDEDECAIDGLHMIVDPLDFLPHGMTAHATVNGTRFRLKPEDILTQIPEVKDDVPEAWLAKVVMPKTSTPEPVEHVQEDLFDFDFRAWC